ncbi:2'-5' RNA ligase family protein [Acrocarpospora catenulata]|uniref:2'-5' RNA ligase family protein n=1 Tax=Acrocarpospora catenulata TaxID=2836182 RepID=UPI001BDA6AC9|nr:2'-5' RNA ligase family protein [Acrocarpospora catenulata]
MRRFTPQFQGRPWPDGARVLHVYALPDPGVDAGVLALASACRPAMIGYPLAMVADDRLHMTIEMITDVTADAITPQERAELAAALSRQLADLAPVTVLCGSPLAGQAGVLLDAHPDDGVTALRERVRAAVRETRGPAAVQNDEGRPHMSLAYAYAEADSGALQSTLRRVSPSHAPLTISAVHLLDVAFHQRAQQDGQTGWELSWTDVARIPLRLGQ